MYELLLKQNKIVLLGNQKLSILKMLSYYNETETVFENNKKVFHGVHRWPNREVVRTNRHKGDGWKCDLCWQHKNSSSNLRETESASSSSSSSVMMSSTPGGATCRNSPG